MRGLPCLLVTTAVLCASTVAEEVHAGEMANSAAGKEGVAQLDRANQLGVPKVCFVISSV